MIYAVSDTRGKWVILRGWHGCLAGQGSVLETGVDDKELNNKIDKYRKRKNILKKSVDILNNAEKERLQVAGIEASKGIQPCGHPETEIWSSNGGTSYCEACEDPEYYHFKVWYKSQESRFNTGQFSSKEEAFSAFLEGVEYGKKRVLWGADDMEGISE